MKVILVTCMVMPELRGITTVCHLKHVLLALNYNSFILTVGIIGVDSHARDMYGNSHYWVIVKVHVYSWKYHPCIN